MRTISPCFAPKSLLISQVERVIPKSWKQNVKRALAKDNGLSKSDNASRIGDRLMFDHLLRSVKEFSSQGHLQKAFEVFSHIQLHASAYGYDQIVHPLSYLLVACAKSRMLTQGRQLHAQMINLGLNQHPSSVSKLATLYSSCDLLHDAHVIAESSRALYPVPWNVVISGYVRNGLFKEALCAFKQMLNLGVCPDEYTYPSVLKACGEALDTGFGRDVHLSINAASHYDRCLHVQNSLISMYAKFGQIELARDIFDKLLEKDTVSWNTMISAYATTSMWEKAVELFQSMLQEGAQVNVIMWNTIAGLYLHKGNFEGVLQLLLRMRNYETQLDDVGMTIGLTACSHIGVLTVGREIHACAIIDGLYVCANVQHALITMYSRCGDLESAYLVFQLMECKCMISWNSIISGYAHCDKAEEAEILVREMFRCGMEPNKVTLASVLPLCARVANLQHGKEIHGYITRHGGIFNDHLVIWNSLIDMYSRSGKILQAKKVFDSLSRKDEITYTSLIVGYGIQGEGIIALELFEEMISSQIRPDHITMVAVLSACSHSCLLAEGELYFDKMWSVFGIKPCLEHFACMVDLYGRAGFLHKALKTIRNMPFHPSPAMWATLIGACHVHGNTELGKLAAEKLLEMRPENSGHYVLIANMYAAAGCWSKLAQVRACMRESRVGKATGYSWIDAGTGFQSFTAGDASVELINGMNPLLDGLKDQMKDDGHICTEDFVIDREAVEEQTVWRQVAVEA